MKDVFKISELSSQETGFFYVILVDGCKPCVESSVELLLKTKCKNLTVIAVGDICSSEWVDDFKKIKKEYLLLEDFNKQIFKYEVGFGKPLLLKVVDNRCVDFLYVTDFDYEKAELILNETCILN